MSGCSVDMGSDLPNSASQRSSSSCDFSEQNSDNRCIDRPDPYISNTTPTRDYEQYIPTLTDDDPIFPPELNMDFTSRDEAYAFWKLYALRIGFGTQKRSLYKFHGNPYRSTFICSRGRKPEETGLNNDPQYAKNPKSDAFSFRRQGEHYTNCQARMVITDDMLVGNWKTIHVVLEHNHELTKKRSVRFFRCHRLLPVWVKRLLEINDLAGVPPRQSFKSVVAQSGGYEKSSWIDKDMANHLNHVRALKMKDGDANALINYFIERQRKCPEFYYNVEFAPGGHLSKVFWADARSRASYRYFSDVVTFDTTYLTNKYGMPFSPVVGVNHHSQSILLGCALLPDETSHSYKWVLSTWLECMNGVAPQGIITDQSASIASAIKHVLPNTRHRLCLWHIMNKLPSKLGSGWAKILLPLVKSIVYNSLSEDEFERGWSEIINRLPGGDKRSQWFIKMYEIRAMWVPVFLNYDFWAGMSTTQRSESINSFFDGFLKSTTTLHMFAIRYEQALRSRWEKENLFEFQNTHRTPKLVSTTSFERTLSTLYSKQMFFVFQAELKRLVNMRASVVSTIGAVITLKITSIRSVFDDNGTPRLKSHDTITQIHTVSNLYHCPCNLFQFKGIVCSHALCSYKQLGIDIPELYITKRWCMDPTRSNLLHSLNYVDRFNVADFPTSQYSQANAKLVHILTDLKSNPVAQNQFLQQLDSFLTHCITRETPVPSTSPTVPHGSNTSKRNIRDPKQAQHVGRPRANRLKSKTELKINSSKGGTNVGRPAKRTRVSNKVTSCTDFGVHGVQQRKSQECTIRSENTFRLLRHDYQE